MANLKYLTYDGLSHFLTKLKSVVAGHLSGTRSAENITIYLNSLTTASTTTGASDMSGDKFTNLDSVVLPLVDTTNAGLMSPASLTKLNGIATGAEVNQNAFSEVTADDSNKITANAKKDTFKISGGTYLSTTASSDILTVNHDNSGVTAGSYGPSAGKTMTANTAASTSISVPYITVDDQGHVTAASNKTLTVYNDATTKAGHYAPTETDGEFTSASGTNATNNGTTVTFMQNVAVDGKNHLTKVTYATVKIPSTPSITVSDTGTGNVISDITSSGHTITVTRDSLYTNTQVDNKDAEVLTAAKAYADQLELSKFDFKGDLPSTATSAGPAAHAVGDVYRIATAGKYFGSSYDYEVGDFVLCTTTGTTANAAHWASLNTNWQVVVPSTVPSITTSATTLATIGGVAVKAKIGSYSPSNHGHTLNLGAADDGIVDLVISPATVTLGSEAKTVTYTVSHKKYRDTPLTSAGTTKTLSHSGTFTVPKVTFDEWGHGSLEDVTYTLPADSNTHYTSKNIVGTAANSTANGTATGTIYLNHLEESVVKSSHSIKGSGRTTVSSDANGNITISTPNYESLKNPYSLTIQGNGTTLATYDGSATKSVNITASSVGAATSGHKHPEYVVGPDTSTANHIATFSGTTGKVIKDSGFTIATSVPSNAVFTDKNVQSSTSTSTFYITGSTSSGTVTGTLVKNASVYVDGSQHIICKGATSDSTGTALTTVDAISNDDIDALFS